MQPLTADELQGAWSDSWRLIERYQAFFHACKDAIGKELGGKDHTTVMHGINQIKQALVTDTSLRSQLMSIREAIFTAAGP